jgi:hypothetical protein
MVRLIHAVRGEHAADLNLLVHREREHETHAWIAFGVITGLGLINAFITFLGQDLAWAGCTIFLFIAILLGTDKPVQVVVSQMQAEQSVIFR